MTEDEYIDVMSGLSFVELYELIHSLEYTFNVKANEKHIILKDEKKKDWYRKFEKTKKSTRIK